MNGMRQEIFPVAILIRGTSRRFIVKAAHSRKASFFAWKATYGKIWMQCTFWRNRHFMNSKDKRH